MNVNQSYGPDVENTEINVEKNKTSEIQKENIEVTVNVKNEIKMMK